MNKVTMLLVTVVLVLGLLLVNFLMADRQPKTHSSGDARGPLMSKDFKSDAVSSISLKKGGTAIDLVRKEKEWVMPLQKNRTAKVDRIVKLLGDVEAAYNSGTRVGKNLDPFELSPSMRTEMTLDAGGKKSTLFVGKNLPETGSFVQREASGPVLEVDKFLATDAGVREEKGATVLDPAFFYDLKIFSDSADDAIDVVIKKGNEVFRVQKVLPGKGPVKAHQKLEKDEKPEWWITEPDGAAAEESKVRSICSTVLNLTGKGYADEIAEKDRGFDKPPAKILIRLKDGEERAMTFGKIDNDDVLVSAVGKADAFKVNKYVYDTCTKTEDVRKKEEKKDDSEKRDEPAKPFAPPTAPKVEGPKVPVIPAPK